MALKGPEGVFMIKNRRLLKSVCLILTLLLLSETFFLATAPGSRLFAEEAENEGEFVASEALSPGEYRREITKLMGSTTEEIETQSYAQWAMLMINSLIMLDPSGTDVMTFQQAVTETLDKVEMVRGFVENMPKYARWVERATTWGFKLFPISTTSRLGVKLLKIQNAMKMLGESERFRNMSQFAKHMKSPSSRGVSACRQWFKKGTPLNSSQPFSGLQTSAMKVGSVLQVVSGLMEFGRFQSAAADDPGSLSFETVEHAINGTILIATAIMLWPPPGVWGTVAFVILGAWELIKGALDDIGDIIAKWHKSYSDSIEFLREEDDEFAAFYDANIGADTSVSSGEGSPVIDPLERSSALVFADKISLALKENPGEGDLAERQAELVENIRAQGILATWYYQQEEAARMLPPNIEDLYVIWNHRADYMAFKPQKPKWNWRRPWEYVEDGLAWIGDSAIQEIWGTEDQFVDDQGKFKQLALFCPDFALCYSEDTSPARLTLELSEKSRNILVSPEFG